MMDESELDSKYFVSNNHYNCPFCKRRHVTYKLSDCKVFDWDNKKSCGVFFVTCNSCSKKSMHLTYKPVDNVAGYITGNLRFDPNIEDIDNLFFHSVPTSFFTLDDRVPKELRELLTESEQCINMNSLTGASACTRKAIYEFLILQNAEGSDYEKRIKSLKKTFPQIDPNLFEILSNIQGMTSDKLHEQSWDKWDNTHLKMFNEILRTLFNEIYFIPDERKKKSAKINELFANSKKDKKDESKSIKKDPATSAG